MKTQSPHRAVPTDYKVMSREQLLRRIKNLEEYSTWLEKRLTEKDRVRDFFERIEVKP